MLVVVFNYQHFVMKTVSIIFRSGKQITFECDDAAYNRLTSKVVKLNDYEPNPKLTIEIMKDNKIGNMTVLVKEIDALICF